MFVEANFLCEQFDICVKKSIVDKTINNGRKHMEKKIHDINSAYALYTELPRGFPTVEVSDLPLIDDSSFTNEPLIEKFGPARQLLYPDANAHRSERRFAMQISKTPNLPNVNISMEAVYQLQGLYETTRINVMPMTPLDSRGVSLATERYVRVDNSPMADGFNGCRHITGPRGTVVYEPR
ncbi:MAG: hypothetical protein LBJ75_02780 [Puniceicoccales bacterium]|nr:hypothetical protein [Puniceicoccales bacterium]